MFHRIIQVQLLPNTWLIITFSLAIIKLLVIYFDNACGEILHNWKILLQLEQKQINRQLHDSFGLISLHLASIRSSCSKLFLLRQTFFIRNFTNIFKKVWTSNKNFVWCLLFHLSCLLLSSRISVTKYIFCNLF